MDPPTQLSTILPSTIARPSSADTDSSDYFSSGVYEYQDSEETTSVRSLGYQKPKHMWMAKEQVLIHNAPMITDLSIEVNASCDADSVIDSPVSTMTSSEIIPTTANNCIHSAVQPPSPNAGPQCSPGPISSVSLVATTSPVNEQKEEAPKRDIVIECDQHPPDVPVTTNDSKLSNAKQSLRPRRNPSRPKCKRRASVLAQKPGRPNLVDKPGHLNSTTRRSRTKGSRDEDISEPIQGPPKDRLILVLPMRNSGKNSRTSSKLKIPTGVPKRIRSKSQRKYDNVSPTSLLTISGLKMRLRRDSVMSDVKKRSRRSTSSTSSNSFRIVESWCDIDAPGGEASRRINVSMVSSPSSTLHSGGLCVGDIVWAKLAGYPYWPSRISAIWARTQHQLSQATPLPSSSVGGDISSLSILATPSDSTLASGYTACVDWLAWDQCSYLSCSKLYPFKESYDKLYNPRTRVKGYADAVKQAKRLMFESDSSISQSKSQFLRLSPTPPLSSIHRPPSAPPSGESLLSTTTSTLDPLSVSHSQAMCEELDDPEHVTASSPCRPTIEQTTPITISISSILPTSLDWQQNIMDSDTLNNLAPLPQLDISGFGDFASHVPTFSEDEDDINASVAEQLRMDFSTVV